MYTVYRHYNRLTNKSYIGMTSQEPKRRWRSGKGYKNNLRMWNDIQNSDWNTDWVHEILCENVSNREEAEYLESLFISWFDSINKGYNTSAYASHHCKHTEESKRKMSEAQTGEKAYWYGKHHSEKSKKKMSDNHADFSGENNPNFGKHHSEESKKKMSENRPSKPVIQFSKTSEFIAEYPSTREAERQTGCNQGHICECCKGRLKTCGGYIWKYKKI